MLWMFNPITYCTYSSTLCIMLLSLRLQKLHVQNLVVLHRMVFLKTRPFVKWNNTEFTDTPIFTSLLKASTHFQLSCKILLFSPLHQQRFFQFVYFEIPREYAWWVLFWPPWWCLLLWLLKVIRTWLTSLLDFSCPGLSYLVQEIRALYYFVCIWCPVHKKNALKRAQFSRYGTTFLTTLKFS